MADLVEEASRLCRECQACCDGTMFSMVEVDADELPLDSRRRLKIVDGPTHIAQPCRHLEASGCGAYQDRPARCRSYACKQQRDHLENGGDLEARLKKVRAIRAIAARLREVGGSHWELQLRDPLSLPSEVSLDLVELAVRLQRDLGWRPYRKEEPAAPMRAEPSADDPSEP